jgi:hypothetical protein
VPSNLGSAGFSGELPAAVNLQSPEEVKLKPNTEYHYEVVATNAEGATEGLITPGVEDQEFLTLPEPPTASTGSASAVTTTSARVAGTVAPRGFGPHPAEDETTYYFQYGGTISYGRQTSIGKTCPDECAGPQESTVLKGLEPGHTYHYRIVASNLNDAAQLNEPPAASVYGGALKPQTAYGADATFTTPSTPPLLSGVSVSNVTQSGATIAATLESQGLPTRWELQLGSTPGRLGDEASGNTTGAIPLSLGVGSLSPGTTYYYRLLASSLDDPIDSITSQPVPVEVAGSFTTISAPAGAPAASLPAPIPYQSIAELDAKEALEAKKLPNLVIAKTLTKAEKLAKALKACRKRSQGKRASCNKQARAKFGPGKSTNRKQGRP